VISLELSTADLLRLRFTVSPFRETLEAGRSIVNGKVGAGRDTCTDLLELTSLFDSSERLASLVKPAATSPDGISDELSGIRTSQELVRMADLLDVIWRELVAPSWRRIRDCLEADILYRARALACEGLAAVLDDLSPRVKCDGNRVCIDMHATGRTRTYRPAFCSCPQSSLAQTRSGSSWPTATGSRSPIRPVAPVRSGFKMSAVPSRRSPI
jgi:hypothetical protein